MGNNSVPKFIFRLSMFPVYRGSFLGRFYCTRCHFDIRQYMAVTMGVSNYETSNIPVKSKLD